MKSLAVILMMSVPAVCDANDRAVWHRVIHAELRLVTATSGDPIRQTTIEYSVSESLARDVAGIDRSVVVDGMVTVRRETDEAGRCILPIVFRYRGAPADLRPGDDYTSIDAPEGSIRVLSKAGWVSCGIPPLASTGELRLEWLGGSEEAYRGKTAQPGATDNPDDAQRLREDP